jgi:hypothetical protein
MAVQKHLQWDCLIGSCVEIRRNGHLVRSGVIDDVMQDSSAVWLAPDGTHGRVTFEAADGYEVWVNAQERPHHDCGSFNPIILYPMP